MFQQFIDTHNQNHKERVTRLRNQLKRQNLDAFLVPRSDKYQGEFIQKCDERLMWISGFSGSAGLCLITNRSAFIFVDGRYKDQVHREINTDIFTPIPTSKITFSEWISLNLVNTKIGYDPWLHTVNEISKLEKISTDLGVSFIRTKNLVDQIWSSQPKKSKLSIRKHPKKYSGISSKEKRGKISQALKMNEMDVAICTKPESICWLLNIRGDDIEHTPIIQVMAFIYKTSKIVLFLRDTDLSSGILKFLGTDVKIFADDDLNKYLDSLADKNIQIDPSTCPIKIYDRIKNSAKRILYADDPCLLPRAIKNKTEIKGCKKAHLVDGTAVVNFLYWLDIEKQNAQLDEITILKKLEEFRKSTGKLKDISFDTISALGANAAIIHYRVSKRTNKNIGEEALLLLDSGGQYEMGTTDLTRTIAVGSPSRHMVNAYTRVLKGMIAISALRWPAGLAGRDIDSFGRYSLWEDGMDYDHGTGHGIGSYLSVHEGPHAISRRNSVSLEPGMLVSNEPGYYQPGKFGIRIENVLLVKESGIKPKNRGNILEFETLSLAPIDKSLINKKLLTAKEQEWLNKYHEEVKRQISPLVNSAVQSWLTDACYPI